MIVRNLNQKRAKVKGLLIVGYIIHGRTRLAGYLSRKLPGLGLYERFGAYGYPRVICLG